MLKEDLIKKLQELPAGTNVCLFDGRKNSHHSGEDPSGNSDGIYPDFKVELETDGIPPFISLSFDNDDYSENGEIHLYFLENEDET